METAENRIIRVAIIGAGLIGKERIKAINALHRKGKEIVVSGIYDPYVKNQGEISKEFLVNFYQTLDSLFQDNPNWIFIAVPHDVAVELTKKCLTNGFNVLVEKPLGRSYSEAKKIMEYVQRPDQLWVGFDYRFFKGINSALTDIKRGKFGRLISVNMVLGHGGDPGMRTSWKFDPVKAGGGCLIDPGIHLLDLCRIISNDELHIIGVGFWEGFWKTGIDEECHILLEAKEGFLINLQVSIVKWRSTFRIEINGDEGYGIITGRNRSYGNQKYIRGKRWGWSEGVTQEKSEELIVESSGEEVFENEIEALLFSDKTSDIRPCSGYEAMQNMKLLDSCLTCMKNKN